MRNYAPDVIYKVAPNAFRFIKKMIVYFDKHGVSKDFLEKRGWDTLYRGLSTRFVKHAMYQEKGFISTTWDKSIASYFASKAGDQGVVQKFLTRDLGPTFRCVIIDTRIAPYLHEAEVLLLPGNVQLKTGTVICNSETMDCKYATDEAMIEMFRQKPMPRIRKMDGGYAPPAYSLRDLCGKYIVFYRARFKQPVEVLGKLRIPTKECDAEHVVTVEKAKMEAFFEHATDIIPEFLQLRTTLQNATAVTPTILKKVRISQGYQVFPALFDHHTKRILTIHLDIPAAFFYEQFDRLREKDVVDAILAWSEKELLI
jgi:hypothetical protein